MPCSSRFSSRLSSGFDKLDNSCIISGTKKHTMLFDISVLPKYNLFITKSVFCNFVNFQKNSETMSLVHVQNFWGVASRVPSLQATLPPFLQIFSVISDTSCHTPHLFFKNTNCVTLPQIIFANLRRLPPELRFPKKFDL